METMRERFVTVTSEMLERDDRLALVLAVSSAGRFAALAARHPTRVIDVGIREQLMISIAGGLALAGLRPIAHAYAPFLVERPFEFLKVDLGHQALGAVLVSIGASYDEAAFGRTHHCPEDIALISSLPDWDVTVPGHPDEAEVLLRWAAMGEGRAYVRLSLQQNGAARSVTQRQMTVIRSGRRATIIAVGPLLDAVLAATDDLDVSVLYATTVRPFDRETLQAVTKEPAIVLVEPYLAGTSSAEVSATFVDTPHRLLALGVSRIEHRRYGTRANHDAFYRLDARGLRDQIVAFVERPALSSAPTATRTL